MVKFLFVQNIFSGFYLKYLSIMQLSSVLQKYGHQCELVMGTDKEIISKIKEYKPDIITISVADPDREWAINISKVLKMKSGKPIIIGGPIAYSNPEIVKKNFIDAIVIGEGEEAILEIANRVQNKKSLSGITNTITYKKGKIIKNKETKYTQNLDTLPFLDRDIYKNNQYKPSSLTTYVQASRGCPYKCSFCFYSTVKNKYNYPERTRRRSVNNDIEEIKRIKKYDIPRISFQDSIFTSDKKWLMKFLRKYQEEIRYLY